MPSPVRHPSVAALTGRAIVALTLVLLALLAAPGHQPSSTQAAGWLSEPIVTGFGEPTSFAISPDGRVFITEKAGAVRVFKNGALLAAPFAQFTVNTYGERGLEGIVFDPNFAANGYVYFHYTYEHHAADAAGPKTNRVVRVTAAGDVMLPGSEVVLVGTVSGTLAQPSCNDHPAGADCIPADARFHSAGGMHFGADGKLYVSLGDASMFGDANALRSQNLDSLAGKIIRIDSNGAAPADNPFYDGNPASNRSKVWVYGLRNPFRFGLQPGTNTPFIGDVGADWWEEINQGLPGRNFGWPCYEGTQQRKSYDTEPLCLALYAAGTATPPFWAFAHDPAGSAVIGGVFNTGNRYPVEYSGAFLFGDAAAGAIYSMTFNPTTVTTILPGAGAPIQFQVGPDGYVYFLAYNSREVRRLKFDAANVPPVAVISATPSAGPLPLNVQFSSAGSYDPDNHPVGFVWNFGDGSPASAEANPSHTYTVAGTFTATLLVWDALGAVGVASTPITSGNNPPVAIISAPTNGRIYTPNQTITFAGSATDVEDGPLPSSALTWEIALVHCFDGGACHHHPYLTQSGSGGVLVAPDHGITGAEFFYVEVKLTATDSVNLTGVAKRYIGPDANADTCMDAFLPASVASPAFLAGAPNHASTGSATTTTYESADVPGAPNASTINWVKTTSAAGEQGSGQSWASLVGTLTVPAPGTYGISFDTDLVADLKWTSTTGIAWSEVLVLGAVLSPTTGLVGGLNQLYSEQAYRLPGGSKPAALVSNAGKALAFTVDLTPGVYYTAMMVLVDSVSGNTANAAANEVGEVWAVTLTRQTALCSVRLAGLGGAALQGLAATGYAIPEGPPALDQHRHQVQQEALAALQRLPMPR